MSVWTWLTVLTFEISFVLHKHTLKVHKVSPSHTFNNSKKMRLISAEVFFYISETKSLFYCCLGKVPVLGPKMKQKAKLKFMKVV